MPVTIRDVAKAAGVSITTVSRALNGYSDVGLKTRNKIQRIAQEMNYRPSAVARSLVMNKTRTIGFLVSDLTKGRVGHYYMYQVLYGLNDRLSEVGYDLVLVSTTSARQSRESYLDFCTERRFDGVIVMGIRLDDPYVREVVESPLPSVMIDVPLLSEHCGYVMSDNVYGAQLAVKHLVSRGHKKIGLVNGHMQAAVSRDRQRGYQLALESAGLPWTADLEYHSDYSQEGGGIGFLDLLSKHPDMTGVFFASDLMAIGGIHAAQQRGMRIPDEVAMVGFDDIELAEFVTPALTTIRQLRYQIGVTAANVLVGMMDREEQPEGRLLVPELVIRSTT